MAEIVRSRIGVLTYLIPTGAFFDEESLAALKDTVADCIEGREVNLVLDFDNVPSLTGAALESLLDVQDMLSRHGGGLKVVNANALVQDIFLVTRVNDYIEVIDKSGGRRTV